MGILRKTLSAIRMQKFCTGSRVGRSLLETDNIQWIRSPASGESVWCTPSGVSSLWVHSSCCLGFHDIV